MCVFAGFLCFAQTHKRMAWRNVLRPQTVAACRCAWMHSTARPRASQHTPASWEPVIGLEMHAQLATVTKAFSPAPTTFAAYQNSNVSSLK